MSRNGSGVYTLPAGNPVIAGTTIATSWANNTLNDLASAMTGSVASDGQTPMTGNLNLNNNNINNVASLSYTGTLTGGTGVINIGSGQIYKDASGNVGIGTSSPSVKLDIVGDEKITTSTNTGGFTLTGAVDNTGLAIVSTNTGGASWKLLSTAGGSGYNQGALAFERNSSLQMVINSSGNVGIGTSSPVQRLQVQATKGNTDNASTGQMIVRDDTAFNASPIAGIQFSVKYNSGGSFSNGTSIQGFKENATDGNFAQALRFVTQPNNDSPTERMRINAAGGISIGTTTASPTSGILLPINGIINTDGGTLYSYSVRDTTTASAANTFIDPTDGFLARSTSSIKYKTNVEDIEPSKYKSIYEMRPVWYRSIGERDRKDWSYYGLIAEEVGEVDPRLVHWAKKEDGTLEAEGVMYERLTVLLLAELKEIKIELNSVKAELALLKA